ncbi:hypothetical protein REPUB_Repub09cG0130500 [Reevesia pubescens]
MMAGFHGRSDWRSKLYTIFVGNLSVRVSKGALWEAFCGYGRVMDVYIPSSNRHGKSKSFTFAFVRYKFYDEMQRAIVEGNGRKIDERLVRVNKARFGWSNTNARNPALSQDATQKVIWCAKKTDNTRVGRSYKDVLVGQKELGVKEQCSKQFECHVTHFETPSNVAPSDMGIDGTCMQPKKVNYEIEMPNDEMEWLVRSAVGRCNGSSHFRDIQSSFLQNSINCTISPMGGITVLVSFTSKDEMFNCLSFYKALFDDYFDHIEPWSSSTVQREVAYWVTLEEVPLQAWNETFFRSLGDKWGSFLKLDKSTSSRSRFDIARLLVLVDSKLSIPSSVTIEVRGIQFKILVSIEDFCSDDWFVSDENMDGCDNGKDGFAGGSRNTPRSSANKGDSDTAVDCNDSICYIPPFQRSSWENANIMIEEVQRCSLDDANIMIEKELVGGSIINVVTPIKNLLLLPNISHCGCVESNCGLFVDLGLIPFVDNGPSKSITGQKVFSNCDNWAISPYNQHQAPTEPFTPSFFGSLRTSSADEDLICFDPISVHSVNEDALDALVPFSIRKSDKRKKSKQRRIKKLLFGASHSSKGYSLIAKKRKLLAKEIMESMADAKFSDQMDSDSLDPDVSDRNWYDPISKEAEETWDIGVALGLKFKGKKYQTIEIFKSLEKEDRERRSV